MSVVLVMRREGEKNWRWAAATPAERSAASRSDIAKRP